MDKQLYLNNMEIIRVVKNNNYTTICNNIYKNNNISLKAKGLLGMILALPPSWDLSISGLASICKEGKRSISSTVNELIEAGYISRTPIRLNNGFGGYEYTVFENPKLLKCAFEDTQNEDTQNEDTPNSTQLNNNIIKPLINKKIIKRFQKPDFNELKDYIKERGDIISAERFYNYYESNGWKVGKNKMKSWKAAVRNWELMNKSKGQIESKVMERLSTHEKAKQILKNIQDGN